MSEERKVAVPEGWEVRGSLPDFDPSRADDEQLVTLTEDLLLLRPPGGAFCIDVGWLPEASRSGAFVCRVVEGDAWNAPIDEVRLRSCAEVDLWIADAVGRVHEAIGEPGRTTAEVVQSVVAYAVAPRVPASVTPPATPPPGHMASTVTRAT